MDYKDYYAVLGTPRTASEKEIRSAYRKLARKWHPDVNPNNKEAEAKFKEIGEAYEVLSDPEKRKKYDELGSRWKEYEQWQRAGGEAQGQPFEWAEYAGQAPGGQYQYRTVSEEDLRDMFGEGQPFSDFFETFFGGGGRQRGGPRAARPRQGHDFEQPVEVSLAEAYQGTTRLLNMQQPDGSTRRLEVKVPPGVTDGSRIRMAGLGAPGQAGGVSGDLYLVISVKREPRFERNGDDLHTRVQARLGAMLLGGEVRVPTPDGRSLALKIPPGTQDGQDFRLRGQGMPHLGIPDQRGDLHAEIHAQLPGQLTQRQRELMEEFAQLEQGSPAGVG